MVSVSFNRTSTKRNCLTSFFEEKDSSTNAVIHHGQTVPSLLYNVMRIRSIARVHACWNAYHIFHCLLAYIKHFLSVIFTQKKEKQRLSQSFSWKLLNSAFLPIDVYFLWFRCPLIVPRQKEIASFFLRRNRQLHKCSYSQFPVFHKTFFQHFADRLGTVEKNSNIIFFISGVTQIHLATVRMDSLCTLRAKSI